MVKHKPSAHVQISKPLAKLLSSKKYEEWRQSLLKRD